jgi:cytochrome c oxidase subunit 1
MNLGAAILTVAVLMGLKVSVVVMFPLPLVGAQMGVWSMESVIVGFTGIYLVLACMILSTRCSVLKMMFFGKKRAGAHPLRALAQRAGHAGHAARRR